MADRRTVWDPWDEVSTKTRALCGSVGVDSGSILMGDAVSKEQLEVLTHTGDGCYPVFAQMVNGHRCLVIDLEASNYGLGVFNESPGRCPFCGECADHSSGDLNKILQIGCGSCGRTFFYDNTEVKDFVHCTKKL